MSDLDGNPEDLFSHIVSSFIMHITPDSLYSEDS